MIPVQNAKTAGLVLPAGAQLEVRGDLKIDDAVTATFGGHGNGLPFFVISGEGSLTRTGNGAINVAVEVPLANVPTKDWGEHQKALVVGFRTLAACEAVKPQVTITGAETIDFTPECVGADGVYQLVIKGEAKPLATAGPQGDEAEEDDALGGGAIAGIVIAVAVVVAIIAAIVTYMVVKKKNRVNQDVEASA
jgi:hypothetical protein